MICWWCGNKLVDAFYKPVIGVAIWLPTGHEVRVHKVCSSDAKQFIREQKVTAQPSDLPPKT